eukprot:CAMPEP_0201518398 /NCGR_PEP_ID=MMETSP0161_2-20130828/9261_1 /ASSEMBLY_ACC=CAM_ASM_000251 /TAXON_ID=180227 /ORGANISM="Neoparamoeba aestuarina, Strain SoJaBio B1-5/56/2" /LENGTH=30 /DNA_ID= /DNA_START= /DNA_END= /DNA_ORIENTATION=
MYKPPSEQATSNCCAGGSEEDEEGEGEGEG